MTLCDVLNYLFLLNSLMHCFDVQDQVVMYVMPANNYWSGLSHMNNEQLYEDDSNIRPSKHEQTVR